MATTKLVAGLSFAHVGALVLPILPTVGTIYITGGLYECASAIITKVKNVKK